MRAKTYLMIPVLFVANCGVAFSAQYYVSKAGDDANPGTKSSPWKSLSKANNKVQPGDIVFIRGGEYQEVLRPGRSGSQDAYITYRAYPGEKPVLTNSPGKTAIVLDNRDYIAIEGIFVDGKKPYTSANLTKFVSMIDANYNIIRDSNFKYALGWNAVEISGSSHHNRILNNRMSDVGGWGVDDGTRHKGDIIRILDNAKFNLVQGNHLTRGGHNLIAVAGSYNVIRNNHLDNSWGSDKGYRAVELTASSSGRGYNVLEDNVIVNSKRSSFGFPMAMKAEGTNQIVRRNLLMSNSQEVISAVTRDGVPVSKNAKIYHNVIYNNGGPGLRLSSFDGGANVDGNVFKNNILLGNRKDPRSGAYDVELLIDVSLKKNIVEGNALVKRDPTDARIRVSGVGTNSVKWFQNNHPNNFRGNIEALPDFVSPDPRKPEDFELNAGSPLIDKGMFLTKTRAAGSGNTVPVADAGYFTDGFGMVEGDYVQIGQNRPVRIKKVNYSTNELVLEEAVGFGNGDGVSLPYNGSAPDIGMHETGGPVDVVPAAPTNLKLEVFPAE